jgi:hypothetical protein
LKITESNKKQQTELDNRLKKVSTMSVSNNGRNMCVISKASNAQSFHKLKHSKVSNSTWSSLSFSRRDDNDSRRAQQSTIIVDPIYTGPESEHEQLDPITIVCHSKAESSSLKKEEKRRSEPCRTLKLILSLTRSGRKQHSKILVDEAVATEDEEGLDTVQHRNESFSIVVNSTMFYHSGGCKRIQ